MTTTVDIFRAKGGRTGATPGVVPVQYGFSFTATATSAALKTLDGTADLTLPSGFIPQGVLFNGAGTGGSSPTFDLGYVSATDVFVNEGDADGGYKHVWQGDSTGGTGLGVKLTADKVVWGGVGSSAPTGGTVSGWIVGVMYDDGTDI